MTHVYMAHVEEFIFERELNIVGKGQKCWLSSFSPLPTMFSKAVCLMTFKGLINEKKSLAVR